MAHEPNDFGRLIRWELVLLRYSSECTYPQLLMKIYGMEG